MLLLYQFPIFSALHPFFPVSLSPHPKRQHYMTKWLECWLAGNFESSVSILYCLYSGSCKILGILYSVMMQCVILLILKILISSFPLFLTLSLSSTIFDGSVYFGNCQVMINVYFPCSLCFPFTRTSLQWKTGDSFCPPLVGFVLTIVWGAGGIVDQHVMRRRTNGKVAILVARCWGVISNS